jgi:hypothetical protein
MLPLKEKKDLGPFVRPWPLIVVRSPYISKMKSVSHSFVLQNMSQQFMVSNYKVCLTDWLTDLKDWNFLDLKKQISQIINC